MPDVWSNKDERQYSKVKESLVKEGKLERRAKEIASRIVNQQRRSEGRTPEKTTQGTGNPNTRLEERTRRQLYNRAAELNVSGRSKMDKTQLIAAIRDHA